MVKRIQEPQVMQRAVGLCAIVILLLACGGCTTGGSKDVPGIRNFGEVSPEIWRGGKPTPEGMQWLADRGLKTIIDLQMEDESGDVPQGVRYVPIRVSLWQCDQVDVAAVMRAIEESPKPVFIHCLVGRDRTGLAVAAWQMTQGMSAAEAIADMERFGTNPFWNEAIKRRIRRLEKEQETASK
ncbi:MAG TPA: tyrosine-protein phosphatase [Tepidisphaeraceae bacterium]|nr:tyrosine-protein phosphatase [Tepidisphaeraceae bacterium]